MIIGVAIRNDVITVKLPKPNRHCDCFEYLGKIGVKHITANDIGRKADDQGFYTHTGRFLNRREAYLYVKRIKQPTIEDANYALVSENLW